MSPRTWSRPSVATERPARGNAKPGRTTLPAALPLPTASEAAFEHLLATFDDEPAHEGVSTGDAGAVTPVATNAADATASGVGAVVTGEALAATGVTPDRSGAAFAAQAPVGAAAPLEPRAFLRDLFERRDEFLDRSKYANIGDAVEFHTKIAGVSFEGRQAIVGGLREGAGLILERQPENPHDPNAIAIRYGALPLGYINRGIAARIAPQIDGGRRYHAEVASITGGGDRHTGVNVFVRRERAAGAAAPRRGGHGGVAEAIVDADAIRYALIGDRPLRESQREVLARIDAGYNTLAVLGTGRGKSFCFQYPAARRALASGAKTLVFYPLRALANDQFHALQRRLGPLGIRILRANGAVDGDERAELDLALEDGSWDILLATPEYASYHRERFERSCNRPALVVIDEAHHIFESKHRPAYGALGDLVRGLGAPQILALTATARTDAFRELRRALALDAWVIDPTIRDNLHLVDARGTTDKYAYVRAVAGSLGKAIVYCNSRSEATKLAEKLRGEFGASVAFYHAGVPSAERAMVEDLFRSGDLNVIVATSAFGEGIDLPDVRDVLLYHLNFDFTEFNQQAGRAGRDGADARIHLLYGESDRRINDYIIAKGAPSLAVLRELYRGMRTLVSGDVLRMNYEDIARTLELDMVEGPTVSIALRIFAEAGLVDAGDDDDGRYVRFRSVTGKVDLTQTTRFAEGQAERENFDRFCTLALAATAVDLEQIINRPIYPDGVALLVPERL